MSTVVKFKYMELGYIGPPRYTSKIIVDQEFSVGLSKSNRSLLIGINLLDSTGNSYPTKTDTPCWYDKEKFTSAPIGIPLKMETFDHVMIFYVEGFFYSYESCYTFIKNSKDDRYKNSIKYLKILFQREYPDKKLKEAPDWRLLKSSGMGNMSIKEFRSNMSILKKSSNIYFVPAVIEFEKITENY